MTETSISPEIPVTEGLKASSPEDYLFSADRMIEDGNKRVKVTFVYAYHSAEYFEKIWDSCKDANLILLEAVTEPKVRRLFRDLNDLNFRLDSDDPKVQDVVLQDLKREYAGSSNMLEFFFSKIIGTGKKIELIDVDIDSPEVAQRTAALREIVGLIDDGLVEEAVTKYPKMIDANIEANESRERIVLQQLREKLADFSEENVHQVAVIQGAIHTPTYHEFRKLGLPSVATEMRFAPHRIVYSPSVILERRRQLFPEQEIPVGDYFRACVGDMIIARGITELNAYPITPAVEWVDYIKRLTHRLSDEEVNFIAHRFGREQTKIVANINRHKELSPLGVQTIKHFSANKVAALTLYRLAKKHNIKTKLTQIIPLLYVRFRDGMFIPNSAEIKALFD